MPMAQRGSSAGWFVFFLAVFALLAGLAQTLALIVPRPCMNLVPVLFCGKPMGERGIAMSAPAPENVDFNRSIPRPNLTVESVQQMTCQGMHAAMDAFGWRVIAELCSTVQAHPAGQKIAEIGLTRSRDAGELRAHFARVLQYMPRARQRLGGPGYGFFHGALWLVVGRGVATWELIRTVYCPKPEFEYLAICMHGVGHGGWVATMPTSITKAYTACDDVGIVTDLARFRTSFKWCLDAPSTFLTMTCSNGFYHGMQEHLDITQAVVERRVSWAWPCDDPSVILDALPGHCFMWNFHQMGVLTGQRQIRKELSGGGLVEDVVLDVRVPGFLAQGNLTACMNTSVAWPEDIRRACIWGLSALAYNFLVVKQADPNIGKVRDPFRPAAFWSQFPAWKVIEESVEIEFPIVDGHPIPMPSRFPLVDLCSIITGTSKERAKSPMTANDEGRWLACVSGFSKHLLNEVWRGTFTPIHARLVHCRPLLLEAAAWLSAEFRAKAYEVCTRAIAHGVFAWPRTGLHQTNATADRETGIWSPQETSSWAEWVSVPCSAKPFTSSDGSATGICL